MTLTRPYDDLFNVQSYGARSHPQGKTGPSGDEKGRGAASTRSPRGPQDRRLEVSQALAAAGVAAWRWEIGDGTISWSPGAAEILGIPELVLKSPELLGRGLRLEEAALLSTLAEPARSGAPLAARIPLRIGQRTAWYDIAGRVLLDERHRPVGATGTAVKVTERHEASEAIVEALTEAQDTLRELRSLVFHWDPNTGRLNIRRQPEGMTIAPDVPCETSFAALLDRMDERDRARFGDALALSWYDGRPFTLELLLRDDDDRPRRALLRSRRASTGGQSDLVGVILD